MSEYGLWLKKAELLGIVTALNLGCLVVFLVALITFDHHSAVLAVLWTSFVIPYNVLVYVEFLEDQK
jgi:general stress protein CsbA